MNNKPTNSQHEIYTFGVKSSFGEFIFKYPWYSMIISLIVLGCLIFYLDNSGERSIIAMKILLPLFISVTAVMRFFHRNLCYRIVINKTKKTISFCLVFNQGIVTAKTKNLEVIIDRNVNLVVDGRKFIIMNNLLHDVVAVLPNDTKIKFVGIWGKLWEKELNLTNRSLR